MAHVLFTKHMKFNPANPKWVCMHPAIRSHLHANVLMVVF